MTRLEELIAAYRNKLSRDCRSRVEIGARQAGSHYREAADR